MKAKKLFVTGTDTGVGKTVLSLLLMKYFYSKKLNPFYLKPFQTGCKNPYDTDSDAQFIYHNIEELNDKDPAESVIYCNKNPKAPWFAARDDKVENNIDLRKIRKVIEEKSNKFSIVIIEGAGGILVPITKNDLIIDSINDVQVIIASRAGLGTINHTLLTIEALRTRGIKPVGVIFLDNGENTPERSMIDENIEAIKSFSGVNVLGLVEKINNFKIIDNKYYNFFNKIV